MRRVRMRLPTLVAWSCDRIGAAYARAAEREAYTRPVLAGVPPGAPHLPAWRRSPGAERDVPAEGRQRAA